MRINLSEINRSDFNVSERYLECVGKVFLINPRKDKHKWSEDERHLRSLLCDESGEIVCSGFGKFHNYLEVPELDPITVNAVLSGNACFTQKADGSLIIRTVINGSVNLRTRGSHILGEDFYEPVMNLIRAKYPRLLDPTLDARYSILFEYVAPDNKIILDYTEPELIVLGLMDLSASPPEFLSSKEILNDLAETYGTNPIRFYDMDGPMEEIINHIRSWKDSEGVVVWCDLPDGKKHLSKIKTAEYIRLHSLKFQFSANKIRQFCWYRNITSEEVLREELFRLGIDWEFAQFILPEFESFCQHRESVINKVSSFLQRLSEENVAELPDRKSKAIRVKELTAESPELFNIGIRIVMGDNEVQHFQDALILEISPNAILAFKKEAEAMVNFLDS